MHLSVCFKSLPEERRTQRAKPITAAQVSIRRDDITEQADTGLEGSETAVMRSLGGCRTKLVPASHSARQVGVTQGDLPGGQIRDRGWAGQSLSLGKSLALPPFCAQQSVLIDGVGPWPEPTGQPCEWTISKVDLPAPGEPPVLTDAHRAETGCPHASSPQCSSMSKIKASCFRHHGLEWFVTRHEMTGNHFTLRGSVSLSEL